MIDPDVQAEFKDIHKRLDAIIRELSEINVHKQHLDDIEVKVSAVCLAHNEAFKPEGMVARMKNFQASCPRTSYHSWIVALWFAMVAGFTGMGTLIKILHS